MRFTIRSSGVQKLSFALPLSRLGRVDFVFLLRTSAIQASLMALGLASVQTSLTLLSLLHRFRSWLRLRPSRLGQLNKLVGSRCSVRSDDCSAFGSLAVLLSVSLLVWKSDALFDVVFVKR